MKYRNWLFYFIAKFYYFYFLRRSRFVACSLQIEPVCFIDYVDDSDECAPGAICRPFRWEVGRPFTVKGAPRITSSEVSKFGTSDESASWKIPQTLSIVENNTFNHDIGLQWLKQAEDEHASVASFARHTLQLMSIGAPSELLQSSQDASIDEIKHAKICYGFASTFLERDVTPRSIGCKQ